MTELTDVVARALAQSPELTVSDSPAHAWAAARESWQALEEHDLTLVGVPEPAGGSGGTLTEAYEVIESVAGSPGYLPVAETSVLAGWLLSECGLEIPPGPLTIAGHRPTDHLRVSAGGGDITGVATRVPWASVASHVVLIAPSSSGGTAISLVESGRLNIVPGQNLAGEPRDRVEVAPGHQLIREAPPQIQGAVRARGALARSVQIKGGLERLQELTVTHARTRRQFGRPIGSFQAVGQLLAGLAAEVAVARAGVESAIRCAETVGVGDREVAMAKVITGRAVRRATAAAHQIFGAIGVTAEHPLHLYTCRLWSWQDEFGSEREWAIRLGQLARTHHDDLWALIAPTSFAGLPQRFTQN